MVNNYTNTEKTKFNQLIKFYCELTKTKWRDIAHVVSMSSLSKIKKGEILPRNVVYDQLLDFFNIHFYARKFDFAEWISEYLETLEDVLENYRNEQFFSCLIELEDELSEYKEEAIYAQYFKVIKFILNYYLYEKYMDEKEIKEMILLLKHFEFEETIRVYLLETMFISNYNYVCSYNILEELNIFIDCKHPILMYCKGLYYKLNANVDIALTYFEKIEQIWEKRGNDYRLFKSKMGKFEIYKNISIMHAEKIAIELLDNKTKLTKSLIPILNYNVAMFYYLNKKNEQAYELFIENIEMYNRTIDWVFVGSICTILNKELPKKIKNLVIYADNPDMYYLQYYRMKSKGASDDKLVNHIMSKIIPNHLTNDIYEMPMWKMFENELIEISERNKKYYSIYFEYLRKMKQICRK